MSGKLVLILGGARSGKTAHAQQLAVQWGGTVTYVATAEAGDAEMRQRIAVHRSARPPAWQTMERTMRLGDVLTEWDANVVIIDCVTLWVSNVLLTLGDDAPASLVADNVTTEIAELLSAWRGAQFNLIVISNEVGLGLVPPYPLGRTYRDVLGHANQQLARAADEVLFMVAGLPMKVK